MMNIDNELDNTLKNLLQKTIVIYLKNKQYKTGKLILYKLTHYFLELTLKNLESSKLKKVEIPYPFAFEYWKNDNILYFDYRLKNISKNDDVLLGKILKMTRVGDNKFYNSILEIEIKE